MKIFGFNLVIVCVLFMVTITAACAKTSPPSQKFGGSWTFNLGRRTFMVLTLKENGENITGTLLLPEHFQVDSTGRRFSKVASVAKEEPITSATVQNDHLHFVTSNPKDKNDRNEFELTITGRDQATLKFADAPFDPWLISRIPGNAIVAVSKDWEPGSTYMPEDNAVSSAEMNQIFEKDQKPRQNPSELSPERWAVLNKEDAERQRQTRKLLDDGKLHTGEDFAWAAFIFQHGSTPEDYLLAHTLATVAIAKGDGDAIWIASATLDRYLQSAGKPQIYGTQFKTPAGKEATQEPFNRGLINDSLRLQLAVPSLEKQEEQRRAWTEQFKTVAGNPHKK